MKRHLLLCFSLCLFFGLACKNDPKTNTGTNNAIEPHVEGEALPLPDEEFLSRRDTMTEVGFNYLLEHYKLEEKIPLKYYSDCETCICSWQAYFSHKILYQYNDCNENGFEVNISFNKTKKKDLFRLVNHLFSDPNLSWNTDSTVYQSRDGSAGCYYRILSEKGTNSLLYFCGT